MQRIRDLSHNTGLNRNTLVYWQYSVQMKSIAKSYLNNFGLMLKKYMASANSVSFVTLI